MPSTSAVAANLMSSPHFARYPSRPTDASCRCVQGAAETPVGLCTVVLAISVDFYGGGDGMAKWLASPESDREGSNSGVARSDGQ